jgi:hypothetical protein
LQIKAYFHDLQKHMGLNLNFHIIKINSSLNDSKDEITKQMVSHAYFFLQLSQLFHE